LGTYERKCCFLLIEDVQKLIQEKDWKVTGFNFGINDGISAGQTMLHCHSHIIPRRNADVINPSGGIRTIIPGKGTY
jgi:diadenosine tetraphosphate (Ap4A) HIT family hydrolase